MADATENPKSATATCDLIDVPESALITCKSKARTKFCRYFKKGFCGYGEKCLFRHIKPRFGSNSSETESCRFFKKASCKFASKCWNSHIRPDGKPYPKPDPLNKFLVVGPFTNEPEETENIPDCIKDAPHKEPASFTTPSAHEKETRRSFKRPRYLEYVYKNCFYYERNGQCNYGDKCWYIHNESLIQVHPVDEPLYELEPDPDHTKLCFNFAFAQCEFGDRCLYVHGDMCQFCDLPLLHPFDEQQRMEHLEACEILFIEDMQVAFAFMRSKDKTCTICLENVWAPSKSYTKQKFGILDTCNHIFCLDCIRRWKVTKLKMKEPNCPACRKKFSIIVPSTHWFENDHQKDEWIAAYKNVVGKKICKFYERGKCRNELECHFVHSEFIKPMTMEDGELVWEDWVGNNYSQSGDQEDPGDLAGGAGNVTDYRDQERIWSDMPSEGQTSQDLSLQSAEQGSFNNWTEAANIVDAGSEQNIEDQFSHDPYVWHDMPSGDQSSEYLVLQSAGQEGASNWANANPLDDSLMEVDIVDDGNEQNVKCLIGQDPNIWHDPPS